jgi:aryl-alcohol dehydrogenase-like predicted oxidoreductase
MGEDGTMTTIQYRSLGRSGPSVSTIGLGCNNFGLEGTLTQSQEGTTAVIETAIELGVTLLDTADIYGGGLSETFMGNALQGKRDRVFIATKFGHADYDAGIEPRDAKGSRRYIRSAVDASLDRLKTDHIDLYQLHTPEPNTPIEETIDALDELVTAGKIRFFGHSNFDAEQIAEAELAAERSGKRRFISSQNYYNLLGREAEKDVLPAVNRFGLGFLPYFPLQNGLFTGKFSRGGGPNDTRIMRQRPHILDDAPWDLMEQYEALCVDRGITMLEATFGWLLAQPGLTSVIAGATKPEQLRQNADAATAWKPSAEEVALISGIFGG